MKLGYNETVATDMACNRVILQNIDSCEITILVLTKPEQGHLTKNCNVFWNIICS